MNLGIFWNCGASRSTMVTLPLSQNKYSDKQKTQKSLTSAKRIIGDVLDGESRDVLDSWSVEKGEGQVPRVFTGLDRGQRAVGRSWAPAANDAPRRRETSVRVPSDYRRAATTR